MNKIPNTLLNFSIVVCITFFGILFCNFLMGVHDKTKKDEPIPPLITNQNIEYYYDKTHEVGIWINKETGSITALPSSQISNDYKPIEMVQK